MGHVEGTSLPGMGWRPLGDDLLASSGSCEGGKGIPKLGRPLPEAISIASGLRFLRGRSRWKARDV